MDQRLSIVTLGVADLKISADFYENKLDWKRTDTGNDNIVFFQLNGMLLALYGIGELAKDATVDPSGNGFKGFTLAYNARSEKEVDDIISGLRQKGVKILKDPQKVFWGGYSSYFSDPDGNLWEVAYNPYLTLDESGNIK